MDDRRRVSSSEQNAIVGILCVMAADPVCKPAIMAGFEALRTVPNWISNTYMIGLMNAVIVNNVPAP